MLLDTDDQEAGAASATSSSPAPIAAGRFEIAKPGAVLAILALINFFNYVDRIVIAPLVIFLEKPHAKGGLGLTNWQAGLLQSAFMLVHAIASVPMGVLADRWLRKRVIALGVGIWCLATTAGGFARTFAQMFAGRAAVGIGEATYAPAATALLSERFPREQRGRVLGVFQLGMVLGGAVGMIVGGIVAQKFGWRASFFVVGVPGLVLTGLVLLVAEPARAPTLRPITPRTSGSFAIELSSAPGAMPAVSWIVVCGILTTFFTGAVVFWAPKFILRYFYGDDTNFTKRVSLTFGLVAVAALALGTMVGSFLADRLEKKQPGRGRLITLAIGLAVAAPMAMVAFLAHDLRVLYVALGTGVFFNAWFAGPILAALHDVVPPTQRGAVTGAYLMAIHLLGDAASPFVVGLFGSLRSGLVVATFALVLAVAAAMIAMPYSRRVSVLKRAART
jgi:MFS family permease